MPSQLLLVEGAPAGRVRVRRPAINLTVAEFATAAEAIAYCESYRKPWQPEGVPYRIALPPGWAGYRAPRDV